jgi:hypothetical protein
MVRPLWHTKLGWLSPSSGPCKEKLSNLGVVHLTSLFINFSLALSSRHVKIPSLFTSQCTSISHSTTTVVAIEAI